MSDSRDRKRERILEIIDYLGACKLIAKPSSKQRENMPKRLREKLDEAQKEAWEIHNEIVDDAEE